MSIPIKTSKLNPSINLQAIENKYDIFEVKTNEKYFPRGAYILDIKSFTSDICSVFFVSGNTFYTLMNKKPGNFTHLLNALRTTKEGDKIVVRNVAVDDLSDQIILSLLLNAIGTFEIDFLHANNLTGHLYCFNPKWLKKGSKELRNVIIKIPTLEFSIKDNLNVEINVRTFSSVLLGKKLGLVKKKIDQYPKYVFSANNTLRRKLKTDEEDGFILKQEVGGRTKIPFLDIKDIEHFRSSKMGMLEYIVAEFNEKYEGMCHIEFCKINEYITEDSPKAIVRDDQRRVQSLLIDTKIKLVDQIRDKDSECFCSKIADILEEKYALDVKIGTRPVKDAFNICIIHEKEYYEDSKDPYFKTYNDDIIQHITLENFSEAESAVNTIIHELLIKRDIKNGQISLFDWSSLNMDSKISFGMRKTIDDVERYFFMDIEPDGSCCFKEEKLDLFHINEFSECINAFTDSSDVRGIIKFGDGNINVIKDTSWFTIPEIEKINFELDRGNKYLRGKEMRRELFSSLTDVKMFAMGDSICYFSGIIGEGMERKIQTSSIIREIKPYENSRLMFEKLLPLMNVVFVRNGQLTTIPFPYKYLREYVKIIENNI